MFAVLWMVAYFYPAMVLAGLAFGEFAALKAVAVGHQEAGALKVSAGALASGFTALLVSAGVSAARRLSSAD